MAGAGFSRSATIACGYNGPPDSAHGGYACATFARAAGLPDPVAVTLVSAPPLDTPLTILPDPRRTTVWSGDTLVATVAALAREPAPVDPVDLATAEAATAGFPGHSSHPFPTCFACGHDRADGSGLRLAPGPVPGRPHTVACPWIPEDAGLSDAARELVWSVLDCPGGWISPGPSPAVLTRFSAVVTGRVEVGAPHVVVATRLVTHGRTVTVGSSLHTGDGFPVAKATAVWTAIPDGLRTGERTGTAARSEFLSAPEGLRQESSSGSRAPERQG